ARVGWPLVTEMRVIPVAGRDSMLLNLSGAHGPFFTRNIVVLKDSADRIGVGEVPGGEQIRRTLEEARALVEGRPISAWSSVLNEIRKQFEERDAGGPGLQSFSLRGAMHAGAAVESAVVDLPGQVLARPGADPTRRG